MVAWMHVPASAHFNLFNVSGKKSGSESKKTRMPCFETVRSMMSRDQCPACIWPQYTCTKINLSFSHSSPQLPPDYPSLLVPDLDDFDQPTLDTWSKLLGHPPLNLSDFDRKDKGYITPYDHGCLLAHWHLMRSLEYRRPEWCVCFWGRCFLCTRSHQSHARGGSAAPPWLGHVFLLAASHLHTFSRDQPAPEMNGSKEFYPALRQQVCSGAYMVRDVRVPWPRMEDEIYQWTIPIGKQFTLQISMPTLWTLNGLIESYKF
jgi:hypothetical protein